MTIPGGSVRRALCVLLLAAALLGAAPASADTAPPRPPATVLQAAQQVVFVGDSITAGGLVLPQFRIDAQLRLRIPASVTVRNEGRGGQQLVGGTNPPPLSQTAPAVIDTMHAGDVLVVAIGMNDLFNYPGDTAWTGAYVTIVNYARSKGIIVYPAQITPVSPDHWNIELLRQRLNQWLLDVYGADALRYQDLLHCQTSGESCNGQTWIDSRYGWPDGIHVDEGAYAVMADYLATRLALTS